MAKSGGFVRVFVLVAGIALVLGGCERGDGDEDSEGATVTTTTSTSRSTSATTSSTIEPEQQRVVVLDDDGVVVDDADESAILRFDEKSLDEAKSAIASVLGPPVKEVDEQCDSGADHAVMWTGLTIYTTDGRFTGWYADRERLATDAGVGPGSTKADLDKAYGSSNVEIHETTLGTEWSAGGVSGIFEGGADTDIVGMWAGTNCVFR